MNRRPTRREFVSLALGVGGGLSLLVWPMGCGRGRSVRVDLSKVFPDAAQAVGVGRDYLARFPEEAVQSQLEARVLQSLEGVEDPARLRAGLDAAIRRDFRRGRVFRHDGWVLSRTEGRLCALAALAEQGGA